MTDNPLRLITCLFCSLFAGLSALAASAPVVSVPRFTHPGAGQVFYFVLTDRFANGSTANDTGGIPGGRDDHGFDPTAISHFHGGDFAGLTAKLDYLKSMGISAVWVTPPFKNKAVQSGTAGYHGYWVLDFLQIDPHLGTNEDFAEFVRQAHARGMRVYMDIIVNHSADVIMPQGGDTTYIDRASAPYRDADGVTFDERQVAYNGVNQPDFPALSAERSFPYEPFVPPHEVNSKNPAWLNDVTLYHNRGNTTFKGENSLYGDFVGLDDLFTEHPKVVQGFIDVFKYWIETLHVDGFRIDTAKHVNVEFWQAFSPAIQEAARRIGRPDFLQFGEVSSETGDAEFLSEYSTRAPIDTTLDFGFFVAARDFVSRGRGATALAEFFATDDYYTDHDSNVHATTTFLGNHDAGRFAYFLQQDNPEASPRVLADLVKLGHGLLFLARGQPVVYFGDEQGMIGTGNDMKAREDMFPSQAEEFRKLPLLGTKRTGADDKFDTRHPFYRLFGALGRLRLAHPALARGAMIHRPTAGNDLFAFSRIERDEKVEYLVALNGSRSKPAKVNVPTSQRPGAIMRLIFDSRNPDAPRRASLKIDADGEAEVSIAPLQFAVWRAETPLAQPAGSLTVNLVSPSPGGTLTFDPKELDGVSYGGRQQLRAEVAGGDGVAEVTFAMVRASRPDHYELLGVDDAPPYRVFWRPPADLGEREKVSLIATVNDLRGTFAAARVDDLTIAANQLRNGPLGAEVPRLIRAPEPQLDVLAGDRVRLAVEAAGTPPFTYQWFHDGREIAGAAEPELVLARAAEAHSGRYRVLVRNLAGTVAGGETILQVRPAPVAAVGRIESVAAFESRHADARRVDVWLPPGYDERATDRYPVIYMHDGQNLFDPQISYGGTPWSVDKAMARLMEARHFPGAIVVGIWNTPKRTAEYFPQKASDAQSLAQVSGLASESAGPLLADDYLRFLVGELKPYVDLHYRTRPERSHTFVMGSSMGGLISAYALAEYPDVFGGAACVSTHWPAADGAVVDYLRKHLPRPGAHRLYFDFGTETLDAQYEPYQLRMDEVLRAAGYKEGADWVTRKFPGAEHSERSWSERLDIPLAFLLAPQGVIY